MKKTNKIIKDNKINENSVKTIMFLRYLNTAFNENSR